MAKDWSEWEDEHGNPSLPGEGDPVALEYDRLLACGIGLAELLDAKNGSHEMRRDDLIKDLTQVWQNWRAHVNSLALKNRPKMPPKAKLLTEDEELDQPTPEDLRESFEKDFEPDDPARPLPEDQADFPF